MSGGDRRGVNQQSAEKVGKVDQGVGRDAGKGQQVGERAEKSGVGVGAGQVSNAGMDCVASVPPTETFKLELPPPKKGPWSPRKRGRPIKSNTVSEAIVFQLAKIGATWPEIAAHCGADEDTVRKHYSDTFNRGREEGKIELRVAGHKQAVQGNSKLWMAHAKQHLGWKDKDDDGPQQIEIVHKRPGE